MRSLKGKRGPCGKLCAACPKRHACKNIPEDAMRSGKCCKMIRRKTGWCGAEESPVVKVSTPGFARWMSHQINGNAHMGEGVIDERSAEARAHKEFRRESEKRMGHVPRTKAKSGTGSHPMARWGNSDPKGFHGYEPSTTTKEGPHLTTQHDLRDPNPAIRNTTRTWVQGKVELAKKRLAAATAGHAEKPKQSPIAKSDKTVVSRIRPRPTGPETATKPSAPMPHAEDIAGATSLMAFSNPLR